MFPGTFHSVYTPQPSIGRGRHFIHYSWIDHHIRVYWAMTPNAKESNEYLPIADVYHCLMAITLFDEAWRKTTGCVKDQRREVVKSLKAALTSQVFPDWPTHTYKRKLWAAVNRAYESLHARLRTWSSSPQISKWITQLCLGTLLPRRARSRTQFTGRPSSISCLH